MSGRPLNFGPLPQVDRNDELQQQSLGRVTDAAPVALFIPRDERANDKGIDMSLEAKLSGCASNHRSSVQVKGTDSEKQNSDGSFSLAVATANLNYLLNGQSPLYILWVAPRDELLYVWAREEARRLEAENPDWQQQQTVTLRFLSKVDNEVWAAIHDRIIREGRMHRVTHDSLARAAATEMVSVGFDPTTLTAITPDQAYHHITSCGFGLVTSGYGHVIRQWGNLLSRSHQGNPVVQFTLGYAEYSLGSYFAARNHLGRALPGRSTLSDFDKYFLDSLLNNCDFKFGRIDEIAYEIEQARIEKEAPPFLALQLRLDRLRFAHLAEREPTKRTGFLNEIHRLVAEIEADTNAPDEVKLHANLIKFFAESAEAGLASLDAMLRMQMRSRMGDNPQTTVTKTELGKALSAEKAAAEEGVRLLLLANKMGHPILIAEAIIACNMSRIIKFIELPLVLKESGQQAEPISEPIFIGIRNELQQAVTLFQRIDCTSGYVRSSLMLAQWFELNNRQEEAIAIASDIFGIARGMGYDDQAAVAEALITGKSDYRTLVNRMKNPPDTDQAMSQMSDGDVRSFAESCIEAMEIPPDRLPMVERACGFFREIAQEKMNWCRHLELLEDKRHMASVQTRYRNYPNWKAACALKRIQGSHFSTDARHVLDVFKGCNCIGCPDRNPKGTSQTT
jgi:hypothetical protein